MPFVAPQVAISAPQAAVWRTAVKPARRRKRNAPQDKITVNIVEQYTHLGTVQHWGGDLLPDAKSKAANCDASYAPLATSMFGSTSVRRDIKMPLSNALCMSRLKIGSRHVCSEAAAGGDRDQ